MYIIYMNENAIMKPIVLYNKRRVTISVQEAPGQSQGKPPFHSRQVSKTGRAAHYQGVHS
jgi:hypothetical protein